MVLDVEREPGESASDGSCIFCAIVRGDAPAEIVLDDPAGIAFLDRRPLLPGHVLLVPRSHVATLPDLRAVAFNGRKSAAIGRPQLAGSGLALIDLPSSSPAFAAMPLADKERLWARLADFLA